MIDVGKRFCSGAAAVKQFNDIPKMFSMPYFGSNWIYWPVVGEFFLETH